QAEEVADEEHQIGRTLGQPAHEVRKPIAPVGDVDAHAVALADQLVLQVSANAVEHLKFKLILGQVAFRGKADGGGDHARVVRGDPVINPARQQELHQADVVSIHIRLAGKGNFGRFLIGTFAQADAAADAEQIRHVLLAAVEVRLDNDPHGL